MAVMTAPKVTLISQASDPKEAILKAAGDLSKEFVFFNDVLVATYIRPEKTAGGIIRPNQNVDEDVFQGKVALVLKKGPNAFQSDADFDFGEQNVEVGEWVMFRAGDGFACTVNGVACRMIRDRNIRMRLSNPDLVF